MSAERTTTPPQQQRPDAEGWFTDEVILDDGDVQILWQSRIRPADDDGEGGGR